MSFSAIYKKQSSSINKNIPAEKESETEKESKGKEKSEEQEKYYSRNHYTIAGQFELPGNDKFIFFSTRLNIHPFQEDDIQPPQAV